MYGMSLVKHKYYYSDNHKVQLLGKLMRNLFINRTGRLSVLFTFSVLLYGCKSTSEEDVEATCRTETSEICSVENKYEDGDMRGYNPCLVNKNLPVCNK